MNMVLLVLHDPEKLSALLDAWKRAGVSGATVLYSTGLGRLHHGQGMRDDLPLMPSLEDFLPKPERMSRTVFSIVPDEETVQKVIAATTEVVGDLCRPDTGLLVVLPVDRVVGVEKNK